MHQIDHHVLPDVDFNGHCLINNIYITKNVINIYISLIQHKFYIKYLLIWICKAI